MLTLTLTEFADLLNDTEALAQVDLDALNGIVSELLEIQRRAADANGWQYEPAIAYQLAVVLGV